MRSGRCRLCGEDPGRVRSVEVGGGLTRSWHICEQCLDSLRELPWVAAEDRDGEVWLSVTATDLMARLEDERMEGEDD